MIIDSHVHLNTESKEKLARAYKKLERQMDEAGVDMAMVMSNFGDTYNPWKDMDRLLELSAKHPRVKPIAIYDHDYPEESTEAITHFVEEGLVHAVKFFLGYQHFYPTSEVIKPAIEVAEANNVPVIFHTGATASYPHTKIKYSFCPGEIDDLAHQHPDLQISCAHFNSPNFLDMAVVLETKGNVHADLSGLFYGEDNPHENRYLHTLARNLGDGMSYLDGSHKKVMFGSDSPICSLSEHLSFLRRFMENQGYSDEAQAAILGGNAKEFFGI